MKRLIQRSSNKRHPLEVDSTTDEGKSDAAVQVQSFIPDEQDRKRIVGCLASLLSTKNYSLQFKRQFLDNIVSYVEIDDSVAIAYLPLTVMDEDGEFGASSQKASTSGEELINIFIDDLDSADTVIWCILRFLLMSDNGYDARVRTVFRDLYSIIYRRNVGSRLSLCSTPSSTASCNSPCNRNDSNVDQFEADNEVFEYLGLIIFGYIEHSIGTNLMLMNVRAQQRQEAASKSNEDNKKKFDIKKIAKITGASILAGTAFAITGGLAAPGIAAGVAVVSYLLFLCCYHVCM